MIISTTITNSRADVIRGCLETIAPEVDFCLVIDTGATDDTMKIAAEVCGSKLIHRVWAWQNDFSAARNFALDEARAWLRWRKGAPGPEVPNEPRDWILTADTDEWPRYPNARAVLAAVPAQVDVLMVSHASRTYRQTRAFRATTKAVWKMPVHEYLENYCSANAPDTWTFECQPRPTEDRTAKYEHYRAVLEKWTAEHPTDPRGWYYLADTLGILGYKGQSIKAFDRCGLLPGWSHQACWARYRQAIFMFELGLGTHAIEACVKGIARSPKEFPELYWLAGWLSYQQGDFAAARDYAKGALALGPQPNRPGFSYPRAQQELPASLLLWAEKQLAGSVPARSVEAPEASAQREPD
jgi:glycosyltransferase involved in cell wall biosynthesis